MQSLSMVGVQGSHVHGRGLLLDALRDCIRHQAKEPPGPHELTEGTVRLREQRDVEWYN